MSGLLKWVESKLDHFDSVAEGALRGPGEEAKLEDLISRLKQDIITLRSLFREKVLEIQEKYQTQLKSLQETNQSLEDSLSQMNRESLLLKENMRNLQHQLASLETIKQQLVTSIDTSAELSESPDSKSMEQLTYENTLISQQVTMYKELLNTEKIKTEDAIREKRQIEDLLDSNKDMYLELSLIHI